MRIAPTLALTFLAAALACTSADGNDDDAISGGDEGEGEAAGEGEGEGGGEGEGEGEQDGFGDISGDCGVLDDELLDQAPATFFNELDFNADPYDDADRSQLTTGGQRLVDEGNGGVEGAALLAQVFAFEVLARCERAVLVKARLDVAYDEAEPPARTDLLLEIDGAKLGMRVLRVGPGGGDPALLLEDTLDDILLATAHVAEEDRWAKHILAVVASSEEERALVAAALVSIDRGTRAGTIVVVTVTSGDDAFLY